LPCNWAPNGKRALSWGNLFPFFFVSEAWQALPCNWATEGKRGFSWGDLFQLVNKVCDRKRGESQNA